MKHRAEIETLVERFLEGRTTSSEERELYAWFASADIPEEWHDLKAMFAWYSEGMPETVIEVDTADTAQCSPQWHYYPTTYASGTLLYLTTTYASAARLYHLASPLDMAHKWRSRHRHCRHCCNTPMVHASTPNI